MGTPYGHAISVFVLIIRQFILKGNRYRFQMIFAKRDECHFVVGVACSVIYPIARSTKHLAFARDRVLIISTNRNRNRKLRAISFVDAVTKRKDSLCNLPRCLFGFSAVPPTLRTRHIPQRVRMPTDGTSYGFS